MASEVSERLQLSAESSCSLLTCRTPPPRTWSRGKRTQKCESNGSVGKSPTSVKCPSPPQAVNCSPRWGDGRDPINRTETPTNYNEASSLAHRGRGCVILQNNGDEIASRHCCHCSRSLGQCQCPHLSSCLDGNRHILWRRLGQAEDDRGQSEEVTTIIHHRKVFPRKGARRGSLFSYLFQLLRRNFLPFLILLLMAVTVSDCAPYPQKRTKYEGTQHEFTALSGFFNAEDKYPGGGGTPDDPMLADSTFADKEFQSATKR